MPIFWSELPAARTREMAADVATFSWVWVWVGLAAQLHAFIAGFAEAGRAIRSGGTEIEAAGGRLAEGIRGVPLVGEQAATVARGAFSSAGRPFIDVGTEVEGLVLALAVIAALLLVAVALIPWLTRYVPWRAARLAGLRAAHRAIRQAPDLSRPEVMRLLASRAVHRLDWATLLEYSDDPLGDWAGGRHDRLARAELASVGLRTL
ncbi:MAG TPA: hypothetical protein VFK38_07240 [Candidatus Limnocylindrales bacterium]|nr:hypothetical protein [Candidatus Limnocylindrales bacterium]